MKALTVRQPWAWAIINGGKDIENRSTLWKHRGPLAIHSAAGWDNRGGREPLILRHTDYADAPIQYGGIIGVATITDAHFAQPGCCTSPWADPWSRVHLVLANPVAVQSIPCKGKLGLWDVPADIEAQLAVAS